MRRHTQEALSSHSGLLHKWSGKEDVGGEGVGSVSYQSRLARLGPEGLWVGMGGMAQE